MSIDEYITSLRKKNILISVNGDQLQIEASNEDLTSEIVNELKSKKPAIIDFFNALEGGRKLKPIPVLPQQPHYPLSHAQRRLWIVDQIVENRGVYNTPLIYPVKTLNVDVFKNAVNQLLLRHEVLRTTIDTIEGEPRQTIKSLEALGLEIHLVQAKTHAEVAKIQYEQCYAPLDLSKSPISITLIALAEGDFVILFVIHHIAIDAWSSEVLYRDFQELYKNCLTRTSPNLPVLRVQYKDYASWQNERLKSGALRDSGKYWSNQLSGELTRLKLPLDYARSDQKKEGRGLSASFKIAPNLVDQLIEVGNCEKATMFMTLTSILKTLLHRYTNQNDIVLGAAVIGREHHELKDQVGYYGNLIVIRSSVHGEETFNQVLKNERNIISEALEHQLYPFDLLVDEIAKNSDSEKNPLFDVLISYNESIQIESRHNTTDQAKPGVITDDIVFTEHAFSKFDLSFSFSKSPDGSLACSIDFNLLLFKKEKIERMVSHFKNLTKEILKDQNKSISHLSYLTQEEVNTLLTKFNNTGKHSPYDTSMKGIFETQVRKTPNAVAIITPKASISFDALNQRTNRLAHLLKEHYHINRGDFVVVMMQSSIDRIAMLLAILKLGAAYVPIDENEPTQRNIYILKDTKPKLIVVLRKDELSNDPVFSEFPTKAYIDLDSESNSFSAENIAFQFPPTGILAILYTSGSTGKPKGVPVKHEGILNRINWFWNNYGFNSQDVIYQKTALVFDVSIGEIFMPLCFGAKLLLADSNTAEQILQNIHDYQTTYIHFSPTLLRNFLGSVGSKMKSAAFLRMVGCSGEELTTDIVKEYYKCTQIPLVNLYGPTEASIEVAYYDVQPGDETIPIGRPIDSVKIHIVDQYNQLLPVGVPGEICIEGIALATGYLNQPEKTKAQFIITRLGSEKEHRIYKTGDIGQWLENGTIEFLGRRDNQVSILGYRIELGEIEAVISKHPRVNANAVLVKEDDFNNPHLIAYFTRNSKSPTNQVRHSKPSTQSNTASPIIKSITKRPSGLNTTGVYQLIEKDLDKHLGSTAIVCGQIEMSYDTLFEQVHRMAVFLKETYHIGNGDYVAIALTRSEKVVVALLAVLKTGAAYVPIDPDYPESRINDIFSDSQCGFVITDGKMSNKINADVVNISYSESVQNAITNNSTLFDIPAPNDLCYVCYTSGSTGKPKGVMIEQHSVIDYILTFTDYFDVNSNDVVIQQSSVAFDTIVEEVFPTLYTGGKLVIIPEGGRDVHGIIKAINQHKVSILSTTPLVLNELNANHEQIDYFPRALINGGDELRKTYIDQLIHQTKIYNTYGPTEATVCASFGLLEDIEQCHIIGLPIHNHKIYVLNDELEQVPEGALGEMFISGPGLARGYLNNESETQEHFIANPFDEGRLYKTGDLARKNDHGRLAFHGRKDNQVKIRGYRVEPSEIDKSLETYEAITNSISVAKTDYDDNKHLVTYYKTEAKVDREDLRSFLSSRLPHYMVPEFYFQVEDFPLTTSGKVDHTALPSLKTQVFDQYLSDELKDLVKSKLPGYMVPSHFVQLNEIPLTISGKIDRKGLVKRALMTTHAKAYITPKNATEEILVEIWKTQLSLPKVSTDANFFEIGGNSIKATQIAALIYKQTQHNVGLKDIYNYTTIREMAQFISNEHKGQENSLLIKLAVETPCRPDVLFIPPIIGSSTIFKGLAESLSNSVNVYGMQYKGFDEDVPFDTSIEEMALTFTREMKEALPGQSVTLVGYSMGAAVAFEMCKLLEKEDRQVNLVLIDRNVSYGNEKSPSPKEIDELLERELGFWFNELPESNIERNKKLVINNLKILEGHKTQGLIKAKISALEGSKNTQKANMEAWEAYTSGDFEHHYIADDHYNLITRQKTVLAEVIQSAIIDQSAVFEH